MNQHAKLPENLTDNRVISHVKPGRTCYTVPWAMSADSDGLLWLNPGYSFTPEPFGTSKMRLELRPDGYHVWPPRGSTWQRQASAGASSQDSVPVAVLHVDES